MSLQAVLLPLFVEIILTFVLMLRMGALRRADYNSGAIKADDVALREPRWPALFYVLTILAWVTRHAGIVFAVLAWVFVICRVLQAYVHVTSNVVRYRSLFFSVGAVVLIVMWALYIIEVLTGVII
jgi:hypothetical protein